MSFYDDHKQLIDQAAHFFVALALTLVVWAVYSVWAGMALTMAGAFVRELSQHDWKPSHLKMGSAIDLAFFALGCLVALIVVGMVS